MRSQNPASVGVRRQDSQLCLRRHSSELKRTIFVVLDLTFRPFQTQYEHFVDKISYLRDVLADEHALIQTRLASKTHNQQLRTLEEQQIKQEEWERRWDDIAQQLGMKKGKDEIESERGRIQKWLNPPRDQNINEALEKSNQDRLEGTAPWILSNPKFVAWKSQNATADTDGFDNILRVAGNLGTGKTLLASSVLSSLQEPQSFGDKSAIPASYFFLYKYEATRNARTAWSLVLAHILDKFGDDEDVSNAFSFAWSQKISHYALTDELAGLLQMVACHLPQLVLILDGLDEANDPEGLAASVASLLFNTQAKAILTKKSFGRPRCTGIRPQLRN
ncbi:hypothetical protein QBC44DRAFT_374675 [Cladorrhinum sp. PSN332]|nr:hypothetical protein QBC44DRAFT_374675 [Cladorrhinum sp. PSN332]